MVSVAPFSPFRHRGGEPGDWQHGDQRGRAADLGPQETGIYKKNGLDTQAVFLGGGDRDLCQSFSRASVHFHGSGLPLVNSNIGGADSS